jgi:hypothetical protein
MQQACEFFLDIRPMLFYCQAEILPTRTEEEGHYETEGFKVERNGVYGGCKPVHPGDGLRQ